MVNFENKVATFVCMLSNAYRDEENAEFIMPLEMEEKSLTEDFTAMLYAMYMLYMEITGDETDIIGFTHILNRLALQQIMEKEEK